MSHFKFLVMTYKKTFLLINFFLSLNILDLGLFFYVENWNSQFLSYRPLKTEVLSALSPPLFENLIRG